MSLSVVFTKMCGAGNDFLITDSTRTPLLQDENFLAPQVPELCNRKFGVGADGVCFLILKKDFIEWIFFNSDGSKASMCGNAACCIVHYIYTNKLQKESEPVILKIQNKMIHGSLNAKKKAEIQSPLPQILKEDVSLDFEGQTISFYQVHSGVDHIVIKNDQVVNPESLRPLSQFLRSKYPTYNITFYKKNESGKISAITFERGVEDFTLACGTGALATAFVIGGDKVFDILMPGGVLNVHLEKKYALLSSPVQHIADVTPKKK